MKNILLIGVGGTGSNAVEILDRKIKELGKQNDNNISAIVFDTDIGDIKNIESATPIPMADIASVGTICDRLGSKNLEDWFPFDNKAVRAQEMIRGASQWRKKSYLAFLNLMNKPSSRTAFISALEKLVLNPSAAVEVYVIASVAGGTGSGSFIPIALYAKRYLRKNLGKEPIVNALIALPDIYAEKQTPENKIKVYANAYAILRELNAINLVSRNYNAGRTDRKKAPIRFKIGSENDPNVGVLFDSMDERFWTPEAAPFSQIFILDKIKAVDSIAAHDIVLADSLYAIICTEIGNQFDSEMSNHELLRSQNNGSNAIYASISTSQIRFPKDSILDYLARKKALEACKDEWLILHNAVERTIQENEKIERESGRRFVLKDGDYARFVLQEIDNQETKGNSKISEIIERSTAHYDENGKNDGKNTAEIYFESLCDYLDGVIPSAKDEIKAVCDGIYSESNLPTNAKDKDRVVSLISDLYASLGKYFVRCVETIKRMSTSLGDSLFTLDKTKFTIEDSLDKTLIKEFRLIKGLLVKGEGEDAKCIHPVAAMVQLCRFKVKLLELLGGFKEDDKWPELKQKNLAAKVPESFIRKAIESNGLTIPNSKYNKPEKSAYLKYSDGVRFKPLDGDEGYIEMKGDARVDYSFIVEDAKKIIEYVGKESRNLLIKIVLLRLSQEVDLLIEKYRVFFSRFDKEKEDLIEDTKTALRKDSERAGSIINVYSSVSDKQNIYDYIIKTTGPESEAELLESDDIVGRGVLNSVYNSASSKFMAAESSDNSCTEYNDNDSNAYRSLFGEMIKSYKKYISNGEAFKTLANYNVIEAINASCPYGTTLEQKKKVYSKHFQDMLDLAKPPLAVNNTSNFGDLVTSSDIMVIMVSTNTAKYILKHAEEFDIKISSEDTKQDKILKSCTESFLHDVAGAASVRVAIVDMPDYQLYCTGETVDITPLRIAKFDEIGHDNNYFSCYEEAIKRSIRYDTDMWNPHIGKDLYKRGYLPYMNEDMEKINDVRMIKALLYGLGKKEIYYKGGALQKNGNAYYFRLKSDDGEYIRANDGTLISKKNIALLVDWIRNENDKILEWSDAFDRWIKDQEEKFPNTVNESEDDILKRAITTCDFIEWFTVGLYEDTSLSTEKKGVTLFEFAYLVKTSEESLRDNDDAERILEVAYSVFKDIINYKVNENLNEERFINLYHHELERVFHGLSMSATIKKSNVDSSSTFTQIVEWVNGAGYFKDIPLSAPIDTKGKIKITEKFNYIDHEVGDIRTELGYSDKAKTTANTAQAPATKTVAAKSTSSNDIVGEVTKAEKAPKAEKKTTAKKKTATKKTAKKTTTDDNK